MLAKQIRANVVVNLKFFARSKLFIGLMIGATLFMALSYVPMLVFQTTARHFDSLKHAVSLLDMVIFLMGALMALIYMPTHQRDRNVKMTLTRPCSPDIWVASLFVSIALSLAVAYLALWIVSLGISFYLDVPVYSGLFFWLFYSFIQSLLIASYLVLLTSVMNPILAAIIAYLLNPSILNAFYSYAIAAVKSYPDSSIFPFLSSILKTLYYAVPDYNPQNSDLKRALDSLRFEAEEISALFSAGAYALAITVFAFILTCIAVRGKRLI